MQVLLLNIFKTEKPNSLKLPQKCTIEVFLILSND